MILYLNDYYHTIINYHRLKSKLDIKILDPDMNSAQRQATLIAKLNDIRREYSTVKSRLSVIDRRKKKIKKRKREQAKAASLNQNKQLQVASGSSTSK